MQAIQEGFQVTVEGKKKMKKIAQILTEIQTYPQLSSLTRAENTELYRKAHNSSL